MLSLQWPDIGRLAVDGMCLLVIRAAHLAREAALDDLVQSVMMLMSSQVELLSWKSEKDISGDGARSCCPPQTETVAAHGRLCGGEGTDSSCRVALPTANTAFRVAA